MMANPRSKRNGSNKELEPSVGECVAKHAINKLVNTKTRRTFFFNKFFILVLYKQFRERTEAEWYMLPHHYETNFCGNEIDPNRLRCEIIMNFLPFYTSYGGIFRYCHGILTMFFVLPIMCRLQGSLPTNVVSG